MGTPESQLRLRKTDQNPSADQNSLSSSSNPGRGPIGSDYNRPIFKLGIVSLSMAILPIGTYFGTLGHVFDKTNTTAAAISAIVVTNIILVGYIFAALSESEDEQNNNTTSTDLQKKKKKDS
ncbi:hypothetical protein PGTUg99_011574 [Puccinia graminis f. sp. tritici]|uniref:Uncharacterized protein n=1 Tax=Puccinia graminis f. sp. tritici TaxID=56615 RepID=A0A5B0RSG7_PUCGR|nr:hypothetical protein PGTUg99_011574 [Puccinia graminis f. sp. tritici]